LRRRANLESWVARLAVALAALCLAPTGHAASLTGRQAYVLTPSAMCGGYPRAPIATMKGLCAGLVVSPPSSVFSERTLRLPRTLLALPSGDFLVVDLGAWVAGKGAVWRLVPRPGQSPQLTRLLDKLDLPHGLAIGPDGRFYLSEMSRIVRFDPNAAVPGDTVETVVTGLPDNRLHDDRHPLSSFIFDGDGALLVDVGARSDQCPPDPATPAGPCAEIQGDHPSAAVWRFAYLGNGRWSQTPTAFSRGLRNSLALVRHPSGTILQGENSIDVDDPDFPTDAIDVLKPGADFGWPYCVEAASPSPAWAGHSPLDCAGPDRTRPALLLPPHGAPLSMLYYQGAMFPELKGRLLVSLHGFRATGSRIIAYDVDAAGVPRPSKTARYAVYGRNGKRATERRFRAGPAAHGLIVTPGWDTVAGLRPAGAPVGLAVAADGALWIAEDRNGAIIRFAQDGGAP
jgi:glucose/arabinose dehydrogenase